MKLYEIAHSRTGDKGDIANLSVIAYRAEDYPLLEEILTADLLADYFHGQVKGPVYRYEVPSQCALNFVLHGALDGGVTRSLSLDGHGKCLSSVLLDIDLPVEK